MEIPLYIWVSVLSVSAFETFHVGKNQDSSDIHKALAPLASFKSF